MTYNEYWQVIDAGLPADELVVFKYEDEGVATLEDGLYVLEDNLEDPAFVDRMARFVRATMKGFDWARENPKAAALIVLDNDMIGAQTEKHQVRMMGEINKLTAGSSGKLDPPTSTARSTRSCRAVRTRSSPRRRPAPGRTQ